MSVGIAGSTTGLSDRVDFSQVVKVYGKPEDGREARYSPGEVTEIKTTPIIGNPDMKLSCTSHIDARTDRFAGGANGSLG